MLPSLERLFLINNQITDEGCAALASALAGGALPSSLRGGPQALKLDNNEATPAGLKKVKAQLKRDKCTMCEDCALKRNHPGICRPT